MSIIPEITTVIEKRSLDKTHSLFRIVFDDEKKRDSFTFRPGQFIMLSIFGVGVVSGLHRSGLCLDMSCGIGISSNR